MSVLDEQYDRLRAADLAIEVLHLELGELLKVIAPWQEADSSFRAAEEPTAELQRYAELQAALKKAGRAQQDARHAISETEVEARKALDELQRQAAVIARLEAMTPAHDRQAAIIADDLRYARGYHNAAQRRLDHTGMPRTKVT
jgi:hypothetical protein